ncbi:homoserine dehydrogenase [Thermanaerosceptrum fracticalcis]|uniref:Homoserine dehydrogenase n=1 Tax=Thermanaerosceptrum fracticalcis TaxID=1712410 RepID=A0A7G6E1E5_THEFR|nr:homoserine dehydrogenase [Thermanaerosceptrum fracticalcis]QNB45899.1 homoserine dehydrogenase [Thermanaerosceptrum fracticalcis]
MEKIEIAILGLGNVGQGVVKILQENTEKWRNKCGANIIIKKVLVRDPAKKRDVSLPPDVVTGRWQEIISDPEIKIIVEVMGGIEPARTYVMEALAKGKNVVTANKDLLAEHGRELFEKSQAAGCDLYFEASVAGGIPIINPLKQSLIANNIEQVMGIVNGTTNYILTRMTQEGMGFADALKRAQELGYAEADPTADVEGYDAARKIAILASLAFHTRVTFQDVYVEGITKIRPKDLSYARELGYTVKLLGIAREESGQVEARVHPALIPSSHPLANVYDSFNAVFVRGDAVGETMFFGRGAGQMPTGSAVVGDIIEVVKNIEKGSTGRLSCTCYEHKAFKPMGEIMTKYYLRLHVIDRPGVLASIAGIFGNHGVSLASVIQKNCEDGIAELVVITHKVRENDIQDALKIIRELSITKEIANLIRVEEN